nr:MaoC family dehydratase N-terminal domain-containing protein [Candidatus Sigynarchaeum springense]MDO8117034.1 MaoC family dehydratase N-terminal domain-containing protein [Candidatus Sigynarchaeota archaeon]
MSARLPPELLEKFKDLETEPIKSKIRNKNTTALAQAIGHKDQKFLGEGATLSPAYIGTLVVKGLFSLADAAVKNDKGEDVKLITNPGKILHGSMGYKYSNLDAVKDGDVLITTGKLTKIFVKNDMLFLYADMTTKKEDGTVIQLTNIGAICRKGGF